MRISACYIVKDEEQNLGKSILSLQGIYDELIVVDTGSTDNTIAIAQKYGAQIDYFTWQNDFSLARNFTLSKATGDWIIFLDADEYYDCSLSIRDYLQEVDAKYPQKDAVIVPRYEAHQMKNPPIHVPRIFRNRPDIYYQGVIHEQLKKKDGDIDYIFAENMIFIHTGYHPDNMERKSQRNLQLLLADVEQNGERDAYYYYIAESYFGLQEYEKAIDYIKKAIASPVRHYREEANYYHILLESMRQRKYPAEEMTLVAEQAIKKFPDMPEFYGEQGIILSSMGRYGEAYRMLSQCIDKYEFTEREKNDYGYFNAESMGIIYARYARIAMMKGRQDAAKIAACYAACISKEKWGGAEKTEIARATGIAPDQEVIICIPVYKKELSPFEKASLKQLNHVLGKYPRVFVAPASLEFDYQEYAAGVGIERFPDYFFNNVTSYSALMLNVEFYQRFTQYKYLLIYQTDAFVFSDRLKEFCAMDYDYIGAPVSRFNPVWHAIDAQTGNGGLSLRKIASAIRMLRQWNDIMKGSPFVNLFMQWEDLFWGYCGRQKTLFFKTAPLKIAAEFAVQANVAHAHKRMQQGWRPFGCHDWYNLDYDFWQEIIESYGFDFSKIPHSGKEAYPRMKLYLATRSTVNMRILWGAYRNGTLNKALSLLDDWLLRYKEGHSGWYHNMEELVCMWRAVEYEDKYNKLWKELYLRKLSIGINRGINDNNFSPILWNLLVTLIPHLCKYDYVEMKTLIAEIESGWWKFWTGNSCYQKCIPEANKKIIAVVTVADESDVVESFIRHTLTFTDAIIIDERFATESVQNILHKLENEGLPLILHKKSLNIHDFDADVDYILKLKATDFILPQESMNYVRQIIEKLPAKQTYAIATGLFAPYQPYANRDKFILARPLVRLDKKPVITEAINIQKENGGDIAIADKLYIARFGQIDTKGLDYGIIPADTELLDISAYIVNQHLQYTGG
ncbi:DUF5672 family protein [Selenomonas ruminantium]|uniref:DUF5672 family protein n=1 Tax=Selenomonas ruminantium TaxID=971 RepID=UPI00047CC626|nr:DUF5672 family protein [Selenomonas ruminantium]